MRCCRNGECLSSTTAMMEVRDRVRTSADFTTTYNSNAGSFDESCRCFCSSLQSLVTLIKRLLTYLLIYLLTYEDEFHGDGDMGLQSLGIGRMGLKLMGVGWVLCYCTNIDPSRTSFKEVYQRAGREKAKNL